MQTLLRYLNGSRNRRRHSPTPLLGESMAAFNAPKLAPTPTLPRRNSTHMTLAIAFGGVEHEKIVVRPTLAPLKP